MGTQEKSTIQPPMIVSHTSNPAWFFRIFIGCQSTSELRLHLNQQPYWKEIEIAHLDRRYKIQEVSHRGEMFVGLLIDGDCWRFSEVLEIKVKFETVLISRCTQLPSENLKFASFPQLFLR
jgi:hypothetical protein